MKEKITEIIKKAMEADAPQLSATPIEILVPEAPAFGHYSTNVAMRLAKAAREKPMEFARDLVDKIVHKAPFEFFEKVEAVEPGFINFWLSKKTIGEEFAKALAAAADGRYGMNEGEKGKKAIVEYTDPNPFKLFHIGHLMSNAIGESISRLIEAQGADVKRLSYGGDVGLHVAKAIFGVLAKKEEIAAIKNKSEREQLEFWAAAYVSGSAIYETDEAAGGAAKQEIDALNKTIFEKSDEAINELYAWGREISIKYFKEMFARLDSKFVHNYWESEIAEGGVRAVEEGLAKKIFEKSEGAVIFKGEPYGLHTRVFINSRGVPTYEAKELGLTAQKYHDFHFDQSVVITGNEQNDYFKVLLRVLDLLMPAAAGKTTHIGHGMLRLASPLGVSSGKTSSKMSSRKGNIITAETLIDQAKVALQKLVSERSNLTTEEREAATEVIAIGAIKYSILKQHPGQDIIFDFEKSLSFEGDSGPYVQYAYARLKSILRKAEERGTGDRKKETGGEAGAAQWAAEDFSALNSEIELALMRKILEFPDIVARAGATYAPSLLATYLHKLASIANKFYETIPILKDADHEERIGARLALVATVARVLQTGLGLLGIKTLEKI